MLMADVIGKPIQDLDTPALLLDQVTAERNIRQMAGFFRNRSCRLRPHFKNHKCTTLTRRQLEAGSAVGVTCAKLGEAEILARAGINDILIANQIVGPAKIDRLITLAGTEVELRVAVDHPDHVRAISAGAVSTGVTVGILVEIDIGMGRCGVSPGTPALELAREVLRLEGVRFDGLQAYEGHLVAVASTDERRRRTQQAMQLAVDTRSLIEQAGIPVKCVSGGSTSTYAITGEIEGIDEIQAGTYPTMDWMYHALTPEFGVALSVLASVISCPKSGVAVLDVGLKGLGNEFGPPRPKTTPELVPDVSLAEEHCVVRGAPNWRVGETVELIPSHACTTCNLYRQIHVHKDGRIVDVWPIEAAGALT
jgi:D-serine deaminase-like pyridoxal phosphate-dependent protein